MKTMLCMTLASILAAFGPGKSEDCSKGSRSRDVARLIEKVNQAVEPTEEQAAQIEAIWGKYEAARAETQEQGETDRAQFAELKAEMREARSASDKAKMKELREQMRELRRNGPGKLMRETTQQIAAVLTPEQLPAFKEVLREERPHRAGKRGKGRPGSRGGGVGVGLQRFADRLADQIDLTEEQQTQLAQITAEHAATAKESRTAHMANRKQHREELQELHAELRDAKEDGDADGAKLIHERIRDLLGPRPQELLKQTLDKIADLMTEEQMPQFQALAEEMQAKAKTRVAEFRRQGKGHGKHKGKHKGKGRQRSQRNRQARPGPPEDF